MAKHLGYYDDWRSAILHCPHCGWTGTFEEGSVEYYRELMDSSCPACHWSSAPILAIVSYPTVVKYGDREIWREPALCEGSKRFEEVVRILITKYGDRLADVVPTPESEYYLYGDDYPAPDAVRAIRKSIKESHCR